MLDSLRLLDRACLFFTIIMFFSLVSSLQIGISPEEVELNMSVGEKICANFDIKVKNYSGVIIVEDKWAKKGFMERDLSKHTYEGKDLGIDSGYEKKIEAMEEQEKEACFMAEKRGDYHGVLIYKTEIQGAGVGSWIVLHVEDNSTRSLKNIVQLTGNVVNDLSGDSYSLQMMLTSSL